MGNSERRLGAHSGQPSRSASDCDECANRQSCEKREASEKEQHSLRVTNLPLRMTRTYSQKRKDARNSGFLPFSADRTQHAPYECGDKASTKSIFQPVIGTTKGSTAPTAAMNARVAMVWRL